MQRMKTRKPYLRTPKVRVQSHENTSSCSLTEGFAADDEDVLDDEDRYLEMLAQNAAESNPDRGAATFGDAADDDDEDDDWEIEELEEDIFFTTPLDSIDAYFAFEGTMQRLASRPDTSALLQHSINAEQQAFIESVLRQGRENREKKLASQQPQAIAQNE